MRLFRRPSDHAAAAVIERRWWRVALRATLNHVDIAVIALLIIVLGVPSNPLDAGALTPIAVWLIMAGWLMARLGARAVPVGFALGILADFVTHTPIGTSSIAFIALVEVCHWLHNGGVGRLYVVEWLVVVSSCVLYSLWLGVVAVAFANAPLVEAMQIYGWRWLQWIGFIVAFAFVGYPISREAARLLLRRFAVAPSTT